jgi:hypothetical protein
VPVVWLAVLVKEDGRTDCGMGRSRTTVELSVSEADPPDSWQGSRTLGGEPHGGFGQLRLSQCESAMGTHVQSRAPESHQQNCQRSAVAPTALGEAAGKRYANAVFGRPMTWQRISVVACAARAYRPQTGASFHVWAWIAAVAAVRLQFVVLFASPPPQPG